MVQLLYACLQTVALHRSVQVTHHNNAMKRMCATVPFLPTGIKEKGSHGHGFILGNNSALITNSTFIFTLYRFRFIQIYVVCIIRNKEGRHPQLAGVELFRFDLRSYILPIIKLSICHSDTKENVTD